MNTLIEWSARGLLPDQDDRLEELAQSTGELPDRAHWFQALDRLLLVTGALLLGCALIFFIAANWSGLPRMARFALAQAAVVIALMLYWRWTDQRSGRAALGFGVLAIGALLALYGQTYQTGADPWQLFAAWAVLALPWVWLTRATLLWLAWLALVDLALWRWLGYRAGFWPWMDGLEWQAYAMFSVHGLALLAAEYLGKRGYLPAQAAWARNLLFLLTLGPISWLALIAILSEHAERLMHLLVWAMVLLATWHCYRVRRVEIAALAASALSVIVISTAALARLLHHLDDYGVWLLLALAIIAMSGIAGRWLLLVSRQSRVAQPPDEASAGQLQPGSETHSPPRPTHAVALWSHLLRLGIVQGEPPASEHIPVSVRIMLGAGAWLASVFALAFLGVTLYGVFSSAPAQLVAAMIAGAIAWRLAPQALARPFAGQIGLALACLMQLLLFWALLGGLRSSFAAGLGLMTVGAISLLIASFIWRMWSCWVLIGGIAVFLQPFQNPWLLAALVTSCAALSAWLLLHPQRWIRHATLARPIALAAGMAALGMTLWHPNLGWSTGLLREFSAADALTRLAAACTAGLLAVASYSVYTMARRLQTGPVLIVGAVLLLAVLAGLTAITPAVSAALGLLVIGYGRRQTALLIFGGLGLLAGLSAHYYALSWSLNFKAASLLALGGLLVLARHLMRLNRLSTNSGERP